jgi:hypothetical protein
MYFATEEYIERIDVKKMAEKTGLTREDITAVLRPLNIREIRLREMLEKAVTKEDILALLYDASEYPDFKRDCLLKLLDKLETYEEVLEFCKEVDYIAEIHKKAILKLSRFFLKK